MSHAKKRVLVFLGDSLTAGYGVGAARAYPALIAERLTRRQAGRFEVVNAGVSGDDTSDGLSRLSQALSHEPEFLVVALGANDMLRGHDPARTRRNLELILRGARTAGSKPVLFGMRAAPLYGIDHMLGFNEIYPRLALEHAVPLLPFFIEDVALRPELNLPDGIHPNAAGQLRIAERAWSFLEPLVLGGAANNPRSVLDVFQNAPTPGDHRP